MGYNTTLMILNDRLGEIERNPEEFVRQLVGAVRNSSHSNGPQSIFAQTTVMPTQHADQPRIYYTQRNSIIELSAYPRAKSLFRAQNGFTEVNKFEVDFWLESCKFARSIIQTVKTNFLRDFPPQELKTQSRM